MAKQKLGKYQKMWINALKGLGPKKYRQAKNQLSRIDKSRHRSYCCLGVACDIFKDKVKGDWIDNLFIMDESQDSYDNNLPFEVLDILKLRADDGQPIYRSLDKGGEKLLVSLSVLNDQKDTHGFSKIVKVLETYPEAYFEKEA